MFFIAEHQERLRTGLNLGTAFINIFLILLLINGVYDGQVFEARIPLLPDISLVFNADPLSLMFVTLSGVLWFFTTIYAIGYFKKGGQRSRFFGFFSLCVFATLGIALAGNLITFLIFYELLTLATYPLIMHKGNAASHHSGKVYLRYTMVGGALLLVGVVWLKSLVGSVDFDDAARLLYLAETDSTSLTLIFLLMLAGLGVKAALFPLHGWLPRAMAAPAPVSSLLHAVAVVKAGAFGIIRLVYDVYGIDLTDKLNMLDLILVLASITIIYGSLRAISQSDIKKRLAYSTVSQVSYIALGVALAGPFAALGAIVHLVHQGLMKITMFFCAGNLAETHHIYTVEKLNGIAKKMPITMSAFTLAIFGMIGMPPLAGFVSKWYLGAGALQSDTMWVQAVLLGSSLLNAIYFLPLVYRAWFLPYQETEYAHKGDAGWMMLLPPIVSISLAMLSGLIAASAFSPLAWARHIAGARQFVFDLPNLPIAVFESHSLWLLLPVMLPLVVVLALVVSKKQLLGKVAFPVISVCACGIAYLLPDAQLHIDFLFMRSVLVLDDISRPFLIMAGLLWLFASLYALFYLHLGKQICTFFIMFGFCMSGAMGLTLSQDMFGFITFFTIMSLASYVLIILSMSDEAKAAASTYIKYVIAGELALFAAFTSLFWYNYSSGTISDTTSWVLVLGLIIGFGIKIGLFGLHQWLPLAHPVAAIPASALLSGFMVKAGVIGLLKFYPRTEEFAWGGTVLIVCGTIGAVYGVLKGLTQQNPKAVLAYSTVSQVGVISAILGSYFWLEQHQPILLTALIFYCFHHAIAKCTLFLSVGLIGNLRQRSLLRMTSYIAILIPALSLIGLPLLSGFYAKNDLKIIFVDEPMVKYALSISSFLTGLIMLHFLKVMRYKAANSSPEPYRTGIALTVVCLGAALVLLFLPFSIPTFSNVLPNIIEAGTSLLVFALSLAVYFGCKRLISFDPGAKQTNEGLPFYGVIYQAVDQIGTKTQALIFDYWNAYIRTAFHQRTSPRESTGETMQSIYVSCLIIGLCALMYLAFLL
ncbi:complex I subunit 5 family protein [Ningiella sp. W23]|uniref:complex I subunit 5 family protein n=1 Tax=Ningiella sp. W23 TaxID=3023715 RepID=UPI003757879B